MKSLEIVLKKIPNDWTLKKLSDVTENVNNIIAGPFGSNLKVIDYQKEGIPLVRLQNIERNRFVLENIVYISKEKADELKYHSFMKGDLLLAKLGDPIGKTCEVKKLNYGIVVGDVVRIRISDKKADKKFVENLLNSHLASIQFNRRKTGTTRSRVNLSQVRNLLFPFPTSLDEQRKIASILTNIEDLIQKNKEIVGHVVGNKDDEKIDNLKKLKKGLMQKLLTGQIRVRI